MASVSVAVVIAVDMVASPPPCYNYVGSRRDVVEVQTSSENV